MRSRGPFFKPPFPALPLLLAVLGTQLLAIVMCGFGLLVTAIPWTVIGLIWVYMLVWMVVLDVAKQVLHRRIDRDVE